MWYSDCGVEVVAAAAAKCDGEDERDQERRVLSTK